MNNYNNSEYRKLRGYLMVKYDSRCQLCSKKSESNHIHHIDGNSLNNEIDNLMIVCVECHRLIHK